MGETRLTVYDRAQTRVDILYHTPGYPDNDLYGLDVMEGILSGRSGRLSDRLVNREQLCTDAGAQNAFGLHNGYFTVWAELKDSADPKLVEQILLDEVARLAKEPPSQREMERNKNTIRMAFVSGLRGLEGISDRLAWFERLRSWEDLFSYPDRIAAVRPEDIPPLIRRYFDAEKKTIGVLINRKDGGNAAER